MNYRLIRQVSSILQLNTVILPRNTLKLTDNYINNGRNLYISAINFTPRFTRELVAEDEVSSDLSSKNDVPKEYSPKNTVQKEPEAVWDEIESGMFHSRRHQKNERQDQNVPKVTFKGLRTFVSKEKPRFNIDQIDKMSRKPENKKNITQNKPKPVPRVSTAVEVYDEDIGKYIKLERDDPLLDNIMLKIQSKKHNETPNIILEGRRLIQEALEAGLTLETLFFSKIEQVKLIKDVILHSKAKLYKVANHNLKLWSQLSTTPGIFGIFQHPENLNEIIEKQRSPSEVIPVTIVLDNIREPNNMGAIIRVAAAAGVDQIVLTKG